MKTFIIVDVQNDFLPTGALPVKNGDEVVPVINSILDKFDLVVATQDWHPADHKSFAVHHEGKEPGEVINLGGIEQILWPVHCVQNTEGAEFVEGLATEKIEKVIRKGTDPEIDSYSGFFDNDHKQATGLEEYLREKGVSEVYMGGLALDVCVKFTALDSQKLGFDTTVVLDATRGVDMKEGDSERAVEEMKSAGVKVITSTDL